MGQLSDPGLGALLKGLVAQNKGLCIVTTREKLTDIQQHYSHAADEAWEIVERGPMPLLQADIHLCRARLFFRESAYPWQSPQHDLAEARRLIFKHGYFRRRLRNCGARGSWKDSMMAWRDPDGGHT